MSCVSFYEYENRSKEKLYDLDKALWGPKTVELISFIVFCRCRKDGTAIPTSQMSVLDIEKPLNIGGLSTQGYAILMDKDFS